MTTWNERNKMTTWSVWLLINATCIVLTRMISVYDSPVWIILWMILISDNILKNLINFSYSVKGKTKLDKELIEMSFANYISEMGIYAIVYAFSLNPFYNIMAVILLCSKLSQLLGLLLIRKEA
jgi:hypothetical protein